MKLSYQKSLLIAVVGLPVLLCGQLRLDEPLTYADGELNTVSSNLWRFRAIPYAEIVNNAIVVDFTAGRTFDGAYQRLWTAPSSREKVYASYQLTVTAAPTEILGVPISGVADVDSPDLYRARVFLKRGIAPETFRIGIATQSALPENAAFFPADLHLNAQYLVTASWDNENLITRLYIDNNDLDAPQVEILGGTARANGFRRFGIQMNSQHSLGRLEFRNILVGEDWASVQQDITTKPGFVLDPPGLLLDERFSYADGELLAVSGGAWRVFPSEGSPFGEIVDGKLVFDYRTGQPFLGEYHRVFTIPQDASNSYASYRLRVMEAPTETTGFNITSFADREVPEAQRARVFMKAGSVPDTFNLGLSVSSSMVAEDDLANAVFVTRDLVVKEDYLIIIEWDNVNFIARLYIDTDDRNAPLIELTGDTPREIRRFALRSDSSVDLGRYAISDLLVGELWNSVLQPFTVKPDPDRQPGWYEMDPVLSAYYYMGGGWAFWGDASGDFARGYIWINRLAENSTGWLYHSDHGWFYLMQGSIAEGLFAYSVSSTGWTYASDAFGDTFFNFATLDFVPWNP